MNTGNLSWLQEFKDRYLDQASITRLLQLYRIKSKTDFLDVMSLVWKIILSRILYITVS